MTAICPSVLLLVRYEPRYRLRPERKLPMRASRPRFGYGRHVGFSKDASTPYEGARERVAGASAMLLLGAGIAVDSAIEGVPHSSLLHGWGGLVAAPLLIARSWFQLQRDVPLLRALRAQHRARH
jgi:hypothetical protein